MKTAKKILLVLILIICFPCSSMGGVIPMEVSWVWQLSTTGDPFASAYVDNTGPPGNSESDADSLGGNFVITYTHTPPGGDWYPIDPFPTQVTLDVKATWTGVLSNSTISFDHWGLGYETYVKSNVIVSPMSAFVPSTEEIGAATSSNFTHISPIILAVGVGSTPFSGSVDIQTLFGFGSGTVGDYTTGSASLEMTGSLQNPTVYITYVPEPATVCLLALGGLALRRKRRA